MHTCEGDCRAIGCPGALPSPASKNHRLIITYIPTDFHLDNQITPSFHLKKMGDSTQKSTHKRKRIELSPFEDPDPSKTSKTTSDKIDLSFDSTYHCLDKLHQKIAKLNDEAEEKRKTLEKRVQQLESQNG